MRSAAARRSCRSPAGSAGPRGLGARELDGLRLELQAERRREPRRAQQAQRVVGERPDREAARRRRDSASAMPPVGSMRLGVRTASGTAIAFTVKSRAARSASIAFGREGA